MKKILTLFFLLYTIVSTFSQNIPVLTFTNTNITGLSNPVDVVNAADGTNRIFIVERGGVIKVYDANYNLLSNNFLTLSGDFTTGGERGLLSLAFHPDYETNRYFFVYYTNGAGGVNIDRFRTDINNVNAALVSSRTNIMTIPKPVVYSNHNGGKLNFGPDNNLYFGLGDSGSGGDPGNLAQNGNSLWGKMIRINVDSFTTAPYHTIPANNPFIGNATVSDSIFNIGLRNPWRWSFDRLNGAMWIGDVGQNAREEINSVPFAAASGINYGWRCYEGLQPYNTGGCLPQSSYQSPIFEYIRSNSTGGFSVTGGYVYRGSTYPLLYGYYVCADYVSNNGWLIKETTPNNFTATLQPNFPANISSFGETESGELFALSLNGQLYTVSALSTLPQYFIDYTLTPTNTHNRIDFTMAAAHNFTSFTIEYGTDGVQFQPLTTIQPSNSNRYTYQHHIQINTTRSYYRIKANNANGTYVYSDVKIIRSKPNKPIEVLVANPTQLQINISEPTQRLQLFSNNGQLIQEKKLTNQLGVLQWNVALQSGTYFIKAITTANTSSSIQFVVY